MYLNAFLYRAPALKALPSAVLNRKVLRIVLKELSTPLCAGVFSERQPIVLGRGRSRLLWSSRMSVAAKPCRSPAASGAYPQR